MSPAEALDRLTRVVEALLAPDGCPWDRKQTPLSLRDYVVEEAFELAEAIGADDPEEAREELGDVLFLLVFVAALYQRRGDFDLAQAIQAATAKMVRRHPHVFDGRSIKDQDELLRTWERIKRQEKSEPSGIFDSLPRALPPLLKAHRLNAKAARHRFTWESDADQADQLRAEWDELQQAVASGDADAVEEEFGDYLFCLTEYGRRLGVKANAALDRANRKFLHRFQAMEALAASRGLDTANFTLADWDALWREVKEARGAAPGPRQGE